MDIIQGENIYKEDIISYEEFCEPFKKVSMLLKEQGVTSEEMK